MLKAYYDNMLLSATDDYVIKDGHYFFPREKVNFSLLVKSETHTQAPHLGKANFYDLKTDRIHAKDVAWYYPNTDSTEKKLENFITFNSKLDKIDVVNTD